MTDRDLTGYGDNPPHPHWPGDARLALQFVLNIEEGAESTILNGDRASETYLHELWGRPCRVAERDPSVESMYEYGSRTGVWRVLAAFDDRKLPVTVFAAGRVLELNREIGQSLCRNGHEIAGHGYRWIDYNSVSEDEERRHIRLTFKIIEDLSGHPPTGWYTGRKSPNTLRLLQEKEGLLYCSDAYNDDLPYWLPGTKPLLIIPYTLVNNDFRYLLPNGFSSGEDFYAHLKDAFDYLWLEGEKKPKMMSVGLHGRISGHPARAMALTRFLDYVMQHDQVWICRREEIARHWIANYPHPAL